MPSFSSQSALHFCTASTLTRPFLSSFLNFSTRQTKLCALRRTATTIMTVKMTTKVSEGTVHQTPKRVCIFSDGTWQNLESKTPTNVLKLLQCVIPEASDGTPQIVYYDSGLGSKLTSPDSVVDRLTGGAIGAGIDERIMDLYLFLSCNYAPGDEVYLFGYSRGAYTVRSLAGLINLSGLVRRDEVKWVKEAYALYRSGESAEGEVAKEFRKVHGDRIPIEMMVCFDTVGALGIPGGSSERYEFHDTVIGENISHAIHVLSVEEDRKSFTPTLMTPLKAGQVTELFFPGGHGGVGGGDDRQVQFANNALKFIVEEMEERKINLEVAKEKVPQNVDLGGGVIDFGAFHGIIKFFTGSGVRTIESVDRCHESVVRRYELVEEWRPPALKPLKNELLKEVKMLRDKLGEAFGDVIAK